MEQKILIYITAGSLVGLKKAIEDDKKEETFAPLRAKADAKEKMIKIIDQIEGNK